MNGPPWACLAGVALKAAARSVMASLWAVNDASTAELVPRFFQNLKNRGLNKARHCGARSNTYWLKENTATPTIGRRSC